MLTSKIREKRVMAVVIAKAIPKEGSLLFAEQCSSIQSLVHRCTIWPASATLSRQVRIDENGSRNKLSFDLLNNNK